MKFAGKSQDFAPGEEVVVSGNDTTGASAKATNYQTEYHRQYSKKKVRVSVYFSKADFRELKLSAETDHLAVATYIRECVRKRAKEEPFLSVVERQLLSDLIFQVQKYGTLLNQAIRKVNATGEVTLDDFELIQQNQALVLQLISEFFGTPKGGFFLNVTDDASNSL